MSITVLPWTIQRLDEKWASEWQSCTPRGKEGVAETALEVKHAENKESHLNTAL